MRGETVEPFEELIHAITDSALYVSRNLANHATAGGTTTPRGDRQVDADVWADDQFYDSISRVDEVGAYASEEREEPVDCGDGPYTVAIDPLDGSTDLVSNKAVGTIVGVYDGSLPTVGTDLVASMMVLYGPYTTMTVAREDEDDVREYLLRDGHRERWGTLTLSEEPPFVGTAGEDDDPSTRVPTLADEIERANDIRYRGATVADIGQMLEYGGLFGSPATDRYPEGKLRTHFEAAPLAYLVESAGGASSDGTKSLLDVEPTGLHDRTPTFLGNAALVDDVEAELSG